MSRRDRTPTVARVAELLRGGEPGRAERAGRTVLKREPRNADAWHLHAMAALEEGSLARARTRLERAIAIRPDSSVFHSNLGAVLERMGDLESSYRAHDRALALDREPADNWFNHGFVLLRLGRPAEAAASLHAARDRDPGDPEVRLNLGRGPGTVRRQGGCPAGVPERPRSGDGPRWTLGRRDSRSRAARSGRGVPPSKRRRTYAGSSSRPE